MNKRWIYFLILAVVMIFALGTGIATADVAINEANFPDQMFRTYVQETMDTDSNGALSDEEIARVTVIDCWSMGVQSMKGLEYFPFVTKIEIGDNKLTELNLSACVNLQELNCYHNQLARLDLSACLKLSGLICSANRLTSLDVSKNNELQYIKCYETPTLTSVNLGSASKPALSTLVLYSDGLNTLDIRNCPKLVSLIQSGKPHNCTKFEGINAYEWENNGCWLVTDKGVKVRVTDKETFDGDVEEEQGPTVERRSPLLDILRPVSASELEAGKVEVIISYHVTNCIFWPVAGVSDTSKFLSYCTPTTLEVWYNDTHEKIASFTVNPEELYTFMPSSETHVADLDLTKPGSYTITATVPGHSQIPLASRSSTVTFTVKAPPAPTGTEPEDPTTATVKNLKYNLNSKKKTAVFTQPKNRKSTSITLPATIKVGGKTYKVTGIAADACKGMSNLSKVSIGKNVTKIGKNAFYNCKALQTVTGGAGVTSIGDSAFASCVKLTSVPVFEKLTTIGASAYKGCKALLKFTLGAKVKSIGKYAFLNCAKLKTIIIKTKLLKSGNVGADAFKGIYSKPAVTCPKGMAKTYNKLLKTKGMPKKTTYK